MAIQLTENFKKVIAEARASMLKSPPVKQAKEPTENDLVVMARRAHRRAIEAADAATRGNHLGAMWLPDYDDLLPGAFEYVDATARTSFPEAGVRAIDGFDPVTRHKWVVFLVKPPAVDAEGKPTGW